jgi:hypothetical protein
LSKGALPRERIARLARKAQNLTQSNKFVSSAASSVGWGVSTHPRLGVWVAPASSRYPAQGLPRPRAKKVKLDGLRRISKSRVSTAPSNGIHDADRSIVPDLPKVIEEDN